MSAAAKAAPWPVDLAFDRAGKKLHVSFDDGAAYDIPFELLRVNSPSAEVKGHRASEAKLVTGKRNVGVTRAEPVGRYAVRIVFDDGHDTGLYSWALLNELGRDKSMKMSAYIDALAQQGASRD